MNFPRFWSGQISLTVASTTAYIETLFAGACLFSVYKLLYYKFNVYLYFASGLSRTPAGTWQRTALPAAASETRRHTAYWREGGCNSPVWNTKHWHETLHWSTRT